MAAGLSDALGGFLQVGGTERKAQCLKSWPTSCPPCKLKWGRIGSCFADMIASVDNLDSKDSKVPYLKVHAYMYLRSNLELAARGLVIPKYPGTT